MFKLMWWLCALGLLGVLAYALTGSYRMYTSYQAAHSARSESERRLSGLQLREAELEARLELLRTVRGEEAVLREKYELSRPGETEYIIIRREEQAASVEQSLVPAIHSLFTLFKW